MNIKRFLVLLSVLVILLTGFLALSGMIKSPAVAAQRQADVSKSISFVNEPAIRMWSGTIEFTDSKFADFRPHAQASAKQPIVKGCMSDEQVVHRRQSGCIQ